jgi:hypothetical protein
MIVTVRAVLVALLIVQHILPKSFLTLLADESHFVCLLQLMRLTFCVAFRAVIPLLATWCSDRDLGIENMFTKDRQ